MIVWGSILEGSLFFWGCWDGFEVYLIRVDEMLECVCLVFLVILGYFVGCVYFYWYDLVDVIVLDEDDCGVNIVIVVIVFFVVLNVGVYERIVVGDICLWDDMGVFDGKFDWGGVISDDGMYFKVECLFLNGFRCGRMIGEFDE